MRESSTGLYADLLNLLLELAELAQPEKEEVVFRDLAYLDCTLFVQRGRKVGSPSAVLRRG